MIGTLIIVAIMRYASVEPTVDYVVRSSTWPTMLSGFTKL